MSDAKLRSAVIVGAAGPDNIGQAIARRFATEGLRVAIAGRNIDLLRSFGAEIGADAYECDISEAVSIEQLFGAVGEVDIAVNTTGLNLVKPFMDTTAADIHRLSDVHLAGTLLFTQAAARAMRNGGSIIHLSSVTAKLLMRDHVAYIATKAGAEAIVRAAAAELAPSGIRVNALAPSLTRTPMTEAVFADPALISQVIRHTPMQRLGHAQDIAAAALWLSSEECFMTGEILQINGGMALQILSL